ncbi:hypothetical protein GL213_06170 [Halogeometricum borinquense]|uniref:Major facilitator superfamily (MFS) profile domain-containing protein n=2 Tax=Halogeometricum borinquense TaxID=60847 RepID=E4NR88_HALBP|nr:hypothetical protein [Halogeometricum borinquense]ADQ66824.1 hypothetical protein Hbor_12350 [Halogeometricum borinquense DSM 11551]ELY30332.1 hypothetical protein C499_03663 [Halogeometricum borinquense DSM 11551]QIB74860.1 hypothetical protein G3I44_11570 [Halogeometricum borinquense]QIQ76141.1 hypothetical protein GL213_06170 [Halogeometricum borinquense]RYJ14056.1 hypothetical protein ELS19_08795 [Halogeometricum borinquense]
MTSLRDRFEESDAFRRGVLGAISGALAGVVLTLLGSNSAGDFLVAIFVGIVTYIALWLLTS